MTNSEAIETLKANYPDPCFGLLREAVDVAINALSTEQEQRWIPVTERLPEDSQFVLMTIRRMGEHYNHKPFISVGYITWNQSLWWCAHDGDCEPNDVRVDAWMPLPEPYAERKQDK